MKTLRIILIYLTISSIVLSQTSEVYDWTKYFEPKDNKIVGIWPHNSRFLDDSRLRELRYRWGFNHALLARSLQLNYYNKLRTAGFDSTKIMKQIKQDTYRKNVEDLPPMWAYYIDEPGELGENLTVWNGITSWIKSNNVDSEIVVGGYKRDSILEEYVETIADHTMFSSYKHWWRTILGFWVAFPENSDQRSDWSDMKNLFGSKFAFTWIGAHRDYEEYYDLLAKAKELGLAGVYLYQLEPADNEVNDSNLDRFAEASAAFGFSDKYYQQVRELYNNDMFVNAKLVGPRYMSDKPGSFDHSIFVFENYVVTNSRIEDHFAETRIVAGAPYYYTIPESKNSSFNSYKEIILKPGFHAERGSEFRAYIGND